MTSTKRKLLVIDQQPALRQMLQSAIPCTLELEEALTGRDGIERVAAGQPDVVLLELSLPDLHGCEVARELRTWTEVPIIALSSNAEESAKIGALDAGADDYITRPFSMGELMARVRVALRRGKGSNPIYELAGIRVDLSARRIWKNGREVHLTRYEFNLFSILVRNAGRVVSREVLLETVWGEEFVGEVQYLRVYMGQLRHKLEQTPSRPKLILTVAGVGYRLKSND